MNPVSIQSIHPFHVLTFIFLLIGCNAYAVTPATETPKQPQAFESDRSVFEYIDRRREAFRNIGLIVICTNWALDPVKIQAAAKPYFGDVKITVNPTEIPGIDKKIHYFFIGEMDSFYEQKVCLRNFPRKKQSALEILEGMNKRFKTPTEFKYLPGSPKLLAVSSSSYVLGKDWVTTFTLSREPSPEREKIAFAKIFGLDSQVCFTTSFCNYLP